MKKAETNLVVLDTLVTTTVQPKDSNSALENKDNNIIGRGRHVCVIYKLTCDFNISQSSAVKRHKEYDFIRC